MTGSSGKYYEELDTVTLVRLVTTAKLLWATGYTAVTVNLQDHDAAVQPVLPVQDVTAVIS